MKARLLLAFLSAAAACRAEPVRFASGSARVSLIELFTSEGCSSCPPADKWLGDLRNDPGLWKNFVPVEFHVNYWDQLGWKDRLASPEYTAREYAYANAWGRPPYTPCFARNGVRWSPSWGSVDGPGAPMGVLSLDIGDGGSCAVEFRPGASAHDGTYVVHVAILGGGITSKVTDGENSGRTLGHEFVVLGVADQVLSSPGQTAAQVGTVTLPHPAVADAKHRAVAAWVTLQGEMEPIQATGGWLPPVPAP